MAVVNQAQTVRGILIRDIPRVLKSSVVTMKFNAPISEATQKRKRLITQRFIPIPCPGPAASPNALSGAYAVQPPMGAPASTKNAPSITTKESSVVQNESMLSTGNAISAAQI